MKFCKTFQTKGRRRSSVTFCHNWNYLTKLLFFCMISAVEIENNDKEQYW